MTRACHTIFTCRRPAMWAGPRKWAIKWSWNCRNGNRAHTNPEGEIIEVLGAPDEEGVDMLSVLRQYNLPLHFPKNVLDEARAIRQHGAAGGIWPGRDRLPAGIRSSRSIRMTRRISTTPFACSGSARTMEACGSTLRTSRIT